MKTILSSVAMLLLGGFAFGTTGCVTEYQTTSVAPTYSATTLPAASRVALVMEFRGGEPTPEERADVRALLSDYLAGKGSVLVEGPDDADYLVHAVLERRNPDNPAEWTVVNTYSAQSLGVATGDDYRWPGGIIEDDYYETTTFSHIGFGIFYPVWFDYWDSPWHRGRLILCPPHRPHHRYAEARWREERRWHRPDRWHPDRRRDWERRDNNRRDEPDRRPSLHRDNDRRRDEARPGDHRERRPESVRPGSDRNRDRGDHRSRPGFGPRPGADSPRHPTAVARPPAPPAPGGHRPAITQPPTRPTTPPSVEQTSDRRPRAVGVSGHGVVVVRPPAERREGARVQPPSQPNHPVRPPVRVTPPPPQRPELQGPPPRVDPRRTDTRGGEPRKFTPPPKREGSGRDQQGNGRPAPRRRDTDDSERDKNTPPR